MQGFSSPTIQANWLKIPPKNIQSNYTSIHLKGCIYGWSSQLYEQKQILVFWVLNSWCLGVLKVHLLFLLTSSSWSSVLGEGAKPAGRSRHNHGTGSARRWEKPGSWVWVPCDEWCFWCHWLYNFIGWYIYDYRNVSDKTRYDQSSIEMVLGLASLQDR